MHGRSGGTGNAHTRQVGDRGIVAWGLCPLRTARRFESCLRSNAQYIEVDMLKYRWKQWKQIVFEAEQYSKERHIEEGHLPKGVHRRIITHENGAMYEGMPGLKSTFGDAILKDGDWIVAAWPGGPPYLVSDDAFRREYEPCDDSSYARLAMKTFSRLITGIPER